MQNLYRELLKSGWFNKINEDKEYCYFYFSPNEVGEVYGIKLSKKNGNITAVMYIAMWDFNIEFDDLFNRLSVKDATFLIFNLNLFRLKDT